MFLLGYPIHNFLGATTVDNFKIDPVFLAEFGKAYRQKWTVDPDPKPHHTGVKPASMDNKLFRLRMAEFQKLARRAGSKKSKTIFDAARVAIANGSEPSEICASLQRTRPEYFN